MKHVFRWHSSSSGFVPTCGVHVLWSIAVEFFFVHCAVHFRFSRCSPLWSCDPVHHIPFYLWLLLLLLGYLWSQGISFILTQDFCLWIGVMCIFFYSRGEREILCLLFGVGLVGHLCHRVLFIILARVTPEAVNPSSACFSLSFFLKYNIFPFIFNICVLSLT